MRNLTTRDLGRPFISPVLTINEKFYKISFLSQILAMVIFCFPPISMKRTASGNICSGHFHRQPSNTNLVENRCSCLNISFSVTTTYLYAP